MRTRVTVDEELVLEAMKLANTRTRRETVELALRRFVQTFRQRRLLALRGTASASNYDYKRARSE